MTRARPARPALLRTMNDRTVLGLILDHGPSSRTDLAERSGLSKPTVADVLARLEDAALVVDAGETVGRRGPNGRLHDVPGHLVLGAALSIEPTRITAELVDVRGSVLATTTRRRADLPSGAPESAQALVREVARAAGAPRSAVREVVVGLPGSYDPGVDQVRYADRIPDWTRPGLVASLRSRFGSGVDVTVDNDVNLALVAERATLPDGAPHVCSLLWLANGIGLATSVGSTLYRGESGGAGEIGYIPVPAGTGRGTAAHVELQDLVGGPAVLRLGHEHGVTGRTAPAVVARAAADERDPASTAFLDELARRIALGLAVIVAVLDPGVVVLGGAVGSAGAHPLASRTARALRTVSPLRCQVRAGSITDDPCLVGARAVAADRARDRLLSAAQQPTSDATTALTVATELDLHLPTPRPAQEVHPR
jgi:predicted NBD/HSP70 family sugar kinase